MKTVVRWGTPSKLMFPYLYILGARGKPFIYVGSPFSPAFPISHVVCCCCCCFHIKQYASHSSPFVCVSCTPPKRSSFCCWRCFHTKQDASLASHPPSFSPFPSFSCRCCCCCFPQAAKMQSSSVVHLIDHDDVSFRLVVHSDDAGSGSSSQDQQFFIGGQPRPNPNSSAATSTLSNMRWDKNNQALVLTSVDAASGDEITVSRHLASQGTVMVQHYRARCAKSGETAEAVTIFRRMAQGY